MNKINFYLESRLAAVKKRAEGYAKHNPAGAYKSALNWQVKYGRKGWRAYDTANFYNDAGDLCAENLDGYNATPCNKIRPNYFDYTGYYVDSFQNEVITPQVVTIKAGRRGVFICPAIAYSESDCATIYFSRGQFAPNDINCDAYESATMEAARLADHLAEREAEQAREADAQFQAEDQAEQLAEDIKDARQTARGLIAAIKAQRKAGIDLGGAICDALTDKLRDYRRQIVKARERREALKDNFWLSVEGGY
jgi:hypothetical protein